MLPINGAAFGPRRTGRFVLAAMAAAGLWAGAASAQVFEVDSGTMRRVDVVVQPRTRSHLGAPPPGLAGAVEAAAARYGLAPELIDSVARRESGYRSLAVSSAGAVGVMQLMPATSRAYGVDPRDPVANLDAGAAYLRSLLDRFDGRIDLALAAYNAGPGAVERHAGVPPYHETKAYIAANLDRLADRSLAQASLLKTGDPP